MEMRTCPKGHFYDGDINATCPVCAAEKKSMRLGTSENKEIAGLSEADGEKKPEIGEIRAVTGMDAESRNRPEIGETRAVPGADTGSTGKPEIGETRAVPRTDAAQASGVSGETEGTNRQVGPEEKENGLGHGAAGRPVAGLFVSMSGPDRGQDYRIHAGCNMIGYGENADICLARGENSAQAGSGEEICALLVYDEVEKAFYYFDMPKKENITRMNGKLVMIPSELRRGDILLLGGSELLFLPLDDMRMDRKA